MKTVEVKSRQDPFVEKVQTKIWKETATEVHGYITDQIAIYGYSLEDLIINGYSNTDMIYLLFKGELPTQKQRKILDALSVILCNPGPRHPATRSVMEAAVSKTHSHHLLPIGLMVLGGQKAAGSVEGIMRYMRLNRRKNHPDLAGNLMKNYMGPEDDLEIAPGFGPHYEQREPAYPRLARVLQNKFEDENMLYLNWSLEFDESLSKTSCGLKVTALASAIFLDIGFHPRVGPGLFQLLSSPGLLAHGLEMINQPISAMPFVSDKNYHHANQDETCNE